MKDFITEKFVMTIFLKSLRFSLLLWKGGMVGSNGTGYEVEIEFAWQVLTLSLSCLKLQSFISNIMLTHVTNPVWSSGVTLGQFAFPVPFLSSPPLPLETVILLIVQYYSPWEPSVYAIYMENCDNESTTCMRHIEQFDNQQI